MGVTAGVVAMGAVPGLGTARALAQYGQRRRTREQLRVPAGDRFELLKYGLAAILVFIGTKMLIVEWVKIPVLVSLSVVATILACSVFASLWYTARKEKEAARINAG